MEQRTFGGTAEGPRSSGSAPGQLGADWGEVSEADARAVLEASVEAGVTFFDTADVYGDGRSEQVLGRFLAVRADDGFFGRHEDGAPDGPGAGELRRRHFREWIDRSRRNLGVDTLRPGAAALPADGGDRGRRHLRRALDALVADGTVAAYGVSVETVDQALAAIARPHVASVQIILNAFRLKPLDLVLPAAVEAGVGIIARVPLASGLLSGKYGQLDDVRR